MSGSSFHYPNFQLPELRDPQLSGNPNVWASLALSGFLAAELA
jgi:hypothetical protein